jgi:hypothetical protein
LRRSPLIEPINLSTYGFCHGLRGRHYSLNSHSSESPAELFTEYLISISQEEAWRGFTRKRFDDLLRGPGGGRMLGNIEMRHTSIA